MQRLVDHTDGAVYVAAPMEHAFALRVLHFDLPLPDVVAAVCAQVVAALDQLGPVFLLVFRHVLLFVVHGDAFTAVSFMHVLAVVGAVVNIDQRVFRGHHATVDGKQFLSQAFMQKCLDMAPFVVVDALQHRTHVTYLGQLLPAGFDAATPAHSMAAALFVLAFD